MFASVQTGAMQTGWLAVSATPVGSSGDYYSSLVQVVLALLVIIGIIVLLIKFLAKKNRQWSGHRSMRIVSGVMLGQHKSMQVVEIGGSLYIVGVGENVTLLDRIDDPERAAAMLASLDPEPIDTVFPSLGSWARRMLQLRRKSDLPHSHSSSDFRELLQQKLSGIHSRKSSMRQLLAEEEEIQRRSTES